MATSPRAAEEPPPTTGPADLSAVFSRVDAAWKERDEPGRMEEIRSLLEQAEALAPDEYGVLWRQGRWYFWRSDDPSISAAERSRLGKRAWAYGDRAAAVNPRGVEGWFFAAVGAGNYSLGIGLFEAFSEGIEGKFRERLSRAESIDPRYCACGIWNAWGRFYLELPWPKFDPEKSEQALRRVLSAHPDNLRGRLYLAELYQKQGRSGAARRLLEEVVARQPGLYDVAEERRIQRRARDLLARWKE